MTKSGNEYVEDVRNALNGLIDKVSEITEGYDRRPLPGSQADQENKSFPGTDAIVSTWSLGGLLIEHSSEHLLIFVKSITEPVQPVACWTCVRSMLETAALAAWLLDPKIDARERMRRYYAHRYDGLINQFKFGQAANKPAHELDHVQMRIEQVERDANKLGFANMRKKNKRTGIGRDMPGPTDLIDEVFGKRVIYKMLSGIAHGHYSTITQLSYEVKESNIDFDGVQCSALQKTLTLDGVFFLGSVAIQTIALPLWYLFEYFGWSQLELAGIIEDVADRTFVRDDHRFWRAPWQPEQQA